MSVRRPALFLASFLIVCGGLVLFPAVDLWAEGIFYVPGAGFVLGDWPPFAVLHRAMPLLAAAVAVAGVALLGVRRPWRGLDWRAGAFLLLALAVGPGLIVNTVFKDHWGRARPAQVAQFGGTARFTPAFVPSDQCARNCSFPAGDPANGFVLVGAGFLIAAPRPRRAAIGGALALGGLIGIVRMAQGGHFLSDVVACGYFVFASTWLLHRWIVRADGLAALAQALRRPSPALQRFAVALVLTAAAGAAAFAWLDRPLARLFADIGPATALVFGFITRFGLSTGYLVAAALVASWFGVAAARTGDETRRRRFLRDAWRAGFVFVAVAGAGLAGDIMKPVFGRARPRLFLANGEFGFTWQGAHAVHWSFPSGHAITIVALAAALTVVARRGWPLYAAAALLVMASRIVLDQHYLSDVLAGAFIGAVAAWAAAAALRARISDSP